MKRASGAVALLLLLPAVFCAQASAGQAAGEIVLTRSYADLPFALRIENSGVYGLAGFELTASGPVLIPHGDARSTRFARRVHGDNTLALYSGREGVLVSDRGDRGTVILEGLRTVHVAMETPGPGLNFTLHLNDDAAYVDLLGVDSLGRSALLLEYYEHQVPLRVRREVARVSPSGAILWQFTLPQLRYASTEKDLDIDAGGAVYQLLTDRNGVKIVRWREGNQDAPTGVLQGSQFGENVHFNDILPVTEPVFDVPAEPLAPSSRTVALRIAESYVVQKYVCGPANLAPVDVTAPDGDIVRTPPWLIAGPNARVPYKWGGFSTIAQFTSGLLMGKFAGDINTSGVSSSAVGVDCSGYVSRCWQLTSHYSTSVMPGITTAYASWDDLKPGDAIHKVGHVRLFLERAPNGAFRVAEAAGRDWSVNYWTFTASDLTAYSPRFYNAMADDYCLVRPALRSVLPGAGGVVRVTWSADGAAVAGFRLYESSDGSTWTQILNESVLTGTVAEVPSASGARFYRVAAVSLAAPHGEGNLSNALGIGHVDGGRAVLLVDGFERESGSFRGPGPLFPVRYGMALVNAGCSVHAVRNTEVMAGTVRLPDYETVFWILGDEGSVTESFSDAEQVLVQAFLAQGGRLFASGSEVGYDLVEMGSTADQAFFTTALRAVYIGDDAGSLTVEGEPGGLFAGVGFTIGQVYDEDYPDVIEPAGGALCCLRYGNQMGAGVVYAGEFVGGGAPGKLVYLGFPLETTADDDAFAAVVQRVVQFFDGPATEIADDALPVRFGLSQNYPNPFNPATTIRYSVGSAAAGPRIGGSSREDGWVKLAVYDLLGREVAVLVNGRMAPGTYEVKLDASRLSSGVYYYRMQAGDFTMSKNLQVLR